MQSRLAKQFEAEIRRVTGVDLDSLADIGLVPKGALHRPQSSYQQSTLQETLSGVKVKGIMVKDIVSLSPLISIDEAVNAYFLRYGYGEFPVIWGEKFLGIVTLKEIKVRHVGNCLKADSAYGRGMADLLGIPFSEISK